MDREVRWQAFVDTGDPIRYLKYRLFSADRH